MDQRRKAYSQWQAWREREMEELREERLELGLPGDIGEEERLKEEQDGREGSKVVEELVEEIVDETEEIIG